jgi:cytochrome c oxidase subunit 1
MGWDLMNLVSTIGAFLIGVSFLVFIYNVVASRKLVTHDPDPWDGRSLEWSVASPAPPHNFDDEPTVTHLDEWWHRKYTEDESGRLVRLPEQPAEPRLATDEEVARIHLPSPSYFPLIAAFGLPTMAYGMLYKAYPVTVIGAVILIAAIYAWGFEPSAEPDDGHHLDAHGHDSPSELTAAGVEPMTEAAPGNAEEQAPVGAEETP